MWRKLEPEEVAFIRRINAVYLSKEQRSFDEVVRQYRQIEEESIEYPPDEQWKVIETKRRISEWIFQHAFKDDQPHEVCRAIWEELVERGFSDDERRYTFSGIYARCCQMNGEFDAGLEVIAPIIPELERGIDDPTIGSEMQANCRQLIPTYYKIREELRAGLREPPDTSPPAPSR